MKVLVIHTYYKQRGGEDSVVENEIKLLRNSGITVNFLGFHNQGNTLLKFLQSPFNYRSYQRTKEAIKTFKPDVIHIHNLHFSGSSAVIFAIRKLNIPLVITLHNYRFICPSGSLFHNGKLFLSSLKGGFPWDAIRKGVYQNSILKTFWLSISVYFQQKSGIFNTVDRFIVLGPHSKALFLDSPLKHLADKMVVKPNFSPTSGRNSNLKIKSTFLYIGRLTEEKGISILLQAFEGSNKKLTIIGTGPLEKMVLEYAARNKNIKFLGEQNRESVDKILDETAALIFPSIWFETFGMVIIEAFSKGVPVIASNLGNIGSLIENGFNGLLFEPGNATDLLAKVNEFENSSENDKFILSTHAKNKHEVLFSPEKNITQLIQIYQDAIENLKN